MEEKKEKEESLTKQLYHFAGSYKYLSILSTILAAISAFVALVPFYYIWKVMQEVLSRIAFGVRDFFGWVGRTEHLRCHFIAFRAGQPHDGDAARTRSGSNGRNGRMLHLLPSLCADEYSIFYHEPPKKEICCAKKRHTAGESGSVPLLHFILGSSRQGDSALPLPDTSVFRPI